MNIILKPIIFLSLKLLLLDGKTTKEVILFAFYINNIFEVFKTYQEPYVFLYSYFFSNMIWFKLKLILSKVKIGITKIFILREKYKIGKKNGIKPNKIEKISFGQYFKIK